MNNCKYPAIYIKRRIHNGSLENALQTVVLGFKHDRYKVVGYQLDIINLVIDNEYLILNDLNQIIIKKNVHNKQESGKIIGTYERNLLGCDTVYSGRLAASLGPVDALPWFTVPVINRNCLCTRQID